METDVTASTTTAKKLYNKFEGPMSDYFLFWHQIFFPTGMTPPLFFEKQSWFTRLPKELSMVTNITRVFDQMSWIMISLMTFFGFFFLLVIVPISNSYGATISRWDMDYAVPLQMEPRKVS